MTEKELAAMIDITMVQNHHTRQEIEGLTDTARKYGCAAVFVMPCYTKLISERLSGSGVCAGGVSGFPDGAATTEIKLLEAQDCLKNGADELDMVINIGWLKSGMDREVREEIRRLKDVVGEQPLKCIIEINDLTEDEAKRASLLVVEGGADFVKTATGWRGSTKLEHIQLIRSTIGDAAKIKAAGGIRTLETAESFIAAGASRLGIGAEAAIRILESIPADSRDN